MKNCQDVKNLLTNEPAIRKKPMSWKLTILIGLCLGGILGTLAYSFLMKCDRELREELPHGFTLVQNEM